MEQSESPAKAPKWLLSDKQDRGAETAQRK